MPPTKLTILIRINLLYLATESIICIASSRVGVKIKTRGLALGAFASLNKCKAGNTNAAVLPVPV